MKEKTGARGWKETLGQLLKGQEFSTFIFIVLASVIISIIEPLFFSRYNIINVLRDAVLFAILGTGMAFVLISGNIELTIGSSMGLSAVLTCIWLEKGIPGVLVLLLLIVLCVAIGCVNAFIKEKLDLPPFIITMCMQYIVRGAVYIITGGLPAVIYGDFGLMRLGDGYAGFIPISVLVMFAVIAIGQVFASKTQIGRNIFAVGSNKKAAEYSGIGVIKTTMIAYGIAGATAALAGVILAGYVSSAQTSAGANYEFYAIASSVIGGVSFSGGEGSIVGVILGAMVIAILRNAFVMLNISGYWQTVVLGVIIILSVSLDRVRRMSQQRVK